ncbi:MAG: P-loop NTPase, partial [Woeseiaceae bacterium]
MRVLLPDGTEADARIKGKRLKPVCGDLVTIKPLADEDEWLITGIEERRNELTRPNTSGRVEVLAANLDYLCVVAAAAPKPDWFIVDRYLCAAELMAIGAAVVFNKADLVGVAAVSELDVYRNIGYDVISCSAVTGAGIDDLAIQLQGHRSIIVGQSGVGKSTTATNLALALSAEGASVGVLDADIYGPSQPRMLGIHGKPESKDGNSLEPMTSYDIQAMSIGFLIDEETPMIWRGPMVTQALEQLLNDTNW